MFEYVGPERDFVGYGNEAVKFAWPGGARLAINFVLNIEEGSERSYFFGDNSNEPSWESHRDFPKGYRDLMSESVFEYGSRRGAHRILDIFEKYDVKATMFAAAVALEKNPPLLRRIVDSPHEVCAHGYRWAEAWTMSRDEESENIDKAVSLLEELTGRRPSGWYSRYSPTIHTRDLLVERDFLYDSDAYNDDLPYYVTVGSKQHVVVPYTATYNDTKFVSNTNEPDGFLHLLKRAVRLLHEEGQREPKMLSIGLHARMMGQAGRADILRDFIEYCQNYGSSIWFARRDEIARHWLENVPADSLDK